MNQSARAQVNPDCPNLALTLCGDGDVGRRGETQAETSWPFAFLHNLFANILGHEPIRIDHLRSQ
jgi:hypothetical protein